MQILMAEPRGINSTRQFRRYRHALHFAVSRYTSSAPARGSRRSWSAAGTCRARCRTLQPWKRSCNKPGCPMNDAAEAFQAAIVAILGSGSELIEIGRLHRFSTGGQRSDRSGWARLFTDCRAGVFGCFRLGISETWTGSPRGQMTAREQGELARQIAADKARREREQRETWRKNADRIRFLQRQCRPVTEGDPVSLYLRRRLALPAFMPPGCITFHPSMAYSQDGEPVGSWPAMVAPLVNLRGEVLALHRTYLEADGQKAEVPGPVKKLTPAAGLVSGASIPLYGPRGGLLGVAEGIETALASYSASGVPTVAAYSAGGVAGFKWPALVARLVIFADADPAGAGAAEKLAERARAAMVRTPPPRRRPHPQTRRTRLHRPPANALLAAC